MKPAFPVLRGGFVLVFAFVALVACGKRLAGNIGDVPASPSGSGGGNDITSYAYEVVRVWPHDPTAFTQGLLCHDGDFLESTGLNGHSTLRDVDRETGRVLKQVAVAPQYFAEGLAVIGDKAYQLTWQNHIGFIYDVSTFQQEGTFSYDGEGWGLTTDGRLLILSDGTNRIRFLDPTNFKVVRTIDVTAAGQPMKQLNELEWIDGEIFANVWQTDNVLRIDPASGRVRGIVDFSGLLSPLDRTPQTDVLNGIAYDPAHGQLFVTGKRWPKVFEVRLVPKPGRSR